MNKPLQVALMVAAAFVPSLAAAAPWAFYNPANGNIHIMNDTGAPLANASILSASGRLTNASSWPIFREQRKMVRSFRSLTRI